MIENTLFRAKRTVSQDPLQRWIEGSYVEYTDIKDNKICGIVSASGLRNDIDPETVGQYTTKDDANGEKIFQHDIVKIFITSNSYVLCQVYWWETGFWTKRIKLYDWNHYDHHPLSYWYTNEHRI